MTSTNSFLGIPVEGDIVRRDPKKKQRPLEEFSPILQAVLNDPSIVEFGWTQYTPHFNDGDPCEFGVGYPWFRTVENVADAPADEDGEYDDEDTWQMELSSNETLGTRPRTWDSESRDYRYDDYTGPDVARYDRCLALHRAMDSEEFDEVLLAAFGDHAQVTVKKDGIKVDFYDHE
ncbi:hypothetical protein ACFQVD_26850 [Streptosporangium amethystogenes subsp. fukuiense]|uniref:Uncharacterized protein n=1 Tax=Streptosporangium amethystogenes subsp. fukuiense TaxID=698418 RepID=A0ABW2T5D4_9ACTN